MGTLHRPFDRLLRFFSELDLGNVKGLIQYGGSASTLINNAPVELQKKAFTSNSELSAAMARSDLVIAHAGVGSIIQANSLEKPLVLLPRLSKYGEHFDDHQLQIADVVRHIPGITVSDDSIEDFRQRVVNFLQSPPTVRRALGGNKLPEYVQRWVAQVQGSM